jgi:predicted amidohydrolase
MALALVQMPPRLGDKEHNIGTVEKAVKGTEATVLVFAEMFLTGYTLRDRVQEMAESLDGPSVKRLDEIAKDKGRWLVIGMPERDPERTGIVYNSALIVSPDSPPETYRKMVLANFGPFEEYQYFSRGDRLKVVKTPVGRLGIQVCFDIFFPEISKAYALMGADALVCISASPSVTKEYFEKILVARAIENTCYVAYANLLGTEKNMTFWGGNRLIGPRGNLSAGGNAYVEELVVGDVDLSELEVARQFRPTIRETRADVLSKLVDIVELKLSGPEE